jgi:hypothetical protein
MHYVTANLLFCWAHGKGSLIRPQQAGRGRLRFVDGLVSTGVATAGDHGARGGDGVRYAETPEGVPS